MTEFIGERDPFARLESEVSADLIGDDDVFALVVAQLGESDPMLPGFMLRPHYTGRLPQELVEAGIEAHTVMPVRLQVETSGSVGADGVSASFATLTYIDLGILAKDGGRLWVYDQAGRLHAVPHDETGFLGSRDSPFDTTRFKAIMAWQRAHNRMIRATKADSTMRLDPVRGVWTNREPGQEVL